MTKRVSKLLLALELAVLAAPVTALFGVFSIGILLSFGNPKLFAVLCLWWVTSATALLALWRFALDFLRDGAVALTQRPNWMWVLLITVTACTGLSWLVRSMPHATNGPILLIQQFMVMFMFGTPAAIPALHLILENQRHKQKNHAEG